MYASMSCVLTALSDLSEYWAWSRKPEKGLCALVTRTCASCRSGSTKALKKGNTVSEMFCSNCPPSPPAAAAAAAAACHVVRAAQAAAPGAREQGVAGAGQPLRRVGSHACGVCHRARQRLARCVGVRRGAQGERRRALAGARRVALRARRHTQARRRAGERSAGAQCGARGARGAYKPCGDQVPWARHGRHARARERDRPRTRCKADGRERPAEAGRCAPATAAAGSARRALRACRQRVDR
mmetsp:Transcript_10769/g.44555  ORF Transcript_10769/g.44555 Transcript_10769/m.44555 type:complete len:242 (+) Transcript_10769:1443-2168(+)